MSLANHDLQTVNNALHTIRSFFVWNYLYWVMKTKLMYTWIQNVGIGFKETRYQAGMSMIQWWIVCSSRLMWIVLAIISFVFVEEITPSLDPRWNNSCKTPTKPTSVFKTFPHSIEQCVTWHRWIGKFAWYLGLFPQNYRNVACTSPNAHISLVNIFNVHQTFANVNLKILKITLLWT